jgi:hypothetical protein
MNRNTLYRRLGCFQGWSGRLRKTEVDERRKKNERQKGKKKVGSKYISKDVERRNKKSKKFGVYFLFEKKLSGEDSYIRS